MSDSHSAYVRAKYGLEKAMGFHLQSRVFPPRPEMYGVALRAVKAMNEGCPNRQIRLNDAHNGGRGPTYRGRSTAPAYSVCEHLNLWWAVEEWEVLEESGS